MGDTAEQLEPISRPEFVIGLVGAVGTEWDPVVSALGEEFERVEYKTETIRLSDLLGEIFGVPAKKEDFFESIKRLMNQGDQLRHSLKQNDAMALLGIAEIRRRRESKNKAASKLLQERGVDDPNQFANVPIAGTVYVLRSLKRPEEAKLLRDVYGRAFYTIGAHSGRMTRVDALVSHIKSTCLGSKKYNGGYRKLAEELSERDEKDRYQRHGQDVMNTFPESDLFIDSDDPAGMRKSIKRFVEILFSYQFHTPTQDEYAMFHATAASRRSADLSRQVGAVIAMPSGDIFAVGCNEVPSAGGGLYWQGDPNDQRDFRLGYDSSQVMKKEIIDEIVGRFAEEGSLPARVQNDAQAILKGAQISNLLEFGRCVHAEMAALTDAARRGKPVTGATLYSTTFPCHMCARHIIAAGVSRVVYLEPYPKSKVKELYKDSVSVERDTGRKNAVSFEPFVGVAPRQYLDFFRMPDGPPRKDDATGDVCAWNRETMRPRLRRFVASYLFIELRGTIRLTYQI
jgi:cytidine deaminase